MKERGVVLRDHEVRCVLAGAKTQLRRPVQLRVPWGFIGGRGEEHDLSCWGYAVEDQWMVLARGLNSRGMPHGHTSIPCPIGEAGDRIWVREAWASIAHGPGFGIELHYRADGHDFHDWEQRVAHRRIIDPAPDKNDKWRPVKTVSAWRNAMFMPRWASRITLEVTGVRVQRLHDISEEDADAEGVLELDGWISEREIARKASEMRWCLEDSRAWFAALWEETNGKTAPWSDNPFAWVVEFKVAEVTGREGAA